MYRGRRSLSASRKEKSECIAEGRVLKPTARRTWNNNDARPRKREHNKEITENGRTELPQKYEKKTIMA